MVLFLLSLFMVLSRKSAIPLISMGLTLSNQETVDRYATSMFLVCSVRGPRVPQEGLDANGFRGVFFNPRRK